MRVGFVGAGQMATALAGGLVDANAVAPAAIWASDPSDAARRRFAERVGRGDETPTLTATNADLAGQVEALVIAVKPQYWEAAAASLGTANWQNTLIVSIVAGLSLDSIGRALQTERVVRVMPNTPCLIGRGAAAFARGPQATAADGQLVQGWLDAVGICFEVDEDLLHAVTGLSGSGPAFVYLMLEALSDGGVRAGLPRGIATQLAAQTLSGAAEMVLQLSEHPGVLKDRVASPAGTTIAGLQSLECAGVRGALIDAVDAAARRSRELAVAAEARGDQ